MKLTRILALILLILSAAAAGAPGPAAAGQPGAAAVPAVPAAPAAYTVRGINVYQACNADTYNEGPHNGTTNNTRWDYDRVDSNPSPSAEPDSAHPSPLDYTWYSTNSGVTQPGWLRDNDGSGVWKPDGPAFDCTDPAGCAPITVQLWVNNDAANPQTPNYNCPEICTFIDRDTGSCNDPRAEWSDPGGAVTPGTICRYYQTWTWDIATQTWSPTSTQDIGIVLPCVGQAPPACTTSQIFGYVYNDLDNDGARDAGETGIAGAVVRVSSAETGYDQAFTIPNGSPVGYWTMTAVPVPADGAAVYTIAVTYPSANWAPTTPSTVLVTLTCTASKQVSQGATQAASLGDRVWYDANGDGLQTAGEAGAAGVTVSLVDAAGVQLNDANGAPYGLTTDANGNYLFAVLRPGVYAVKFTPPAGYGLTAANVGANDVSDSDPAPATLRTATYTLAAGASNLTVDAGLVAQAVYDFGDLPASYGTTAAGGGPRHTLTAALYLGAAVDDEADGQPTADATGDDAAGATPDDEDGITLLTGIRPGQPACVAVTAHNATAASAALQGWFDFNNDGDFADPGEAVALSNATIPVGGVTGQPSCFTVPALAAAPPQIAYRFRLSAAGGLSAGGDAADGEVEDSRTALVCLGDRVWRDANRDGLQDGGEADLPGVTVRLLDAAAAELGTAVTDGAGRYGFCGLLPGQPVQLEVAPPAGYVFSPADQGSDNALDSDVTPSAALPGAAARSALIPVGASDDLSWDAGLFETYCLGDRLWIDSDRDGLQAAAETGAPGLTVRLLAASGAELATVVTDAAGNYQFCGLYAGQQVRLRFTAPATYTLSPANQGSDDAVDSDFTLGDAEAETPLLTLPAAHDFTWDGGLVFPAGPLAQLGDTVWLDLNADGIQDAPEPGAPDVTVTLYNSANTRLDTTTTDATGYYEFGVPAAGGYYVVFTAPPGYVFSPANQGSDDAVDSDAVGAGQSGTVLLAAGNFNQTLDAGLVPPLDWGDLPAAYPTQFVVNGARHRVVAGFALGASLDAESDGQSSPDASGDGADEDGVVRLGAPNSTSGGWTDGLAAAGAGCKLALVVSGHSGTVQAWLDFGHGLQAVVLRDAAGTPIPGGVLATGPHIVTCDVPAGTFGGGNRTIFARFRLSSAGGLAATGVAADGEVEDYVFAFGPTAVSLSGFTAQAAPGEDARWIALYGVVGVLGALALMAGVLRARRRREDSHDQ